jgi:hypothetical protein
LIRVTEVLDYFAEPKLVAWKVKLGLKEANKIGRHAMKVGSRVDELIKAKALPKPKDLDEVKQCIKAWESFCKDYSISSFDIGKRLYWQEEDLIGEPDILIPSMLIDIKCSSAIRDKYWLQVCKYNQIEQRKMVAILRLDSSLGYYEFKTNEDVGLDLAYGISVFDGLHHAYRFLNRNKMESLKESSNGDSNEAEVGITDPKIGD